MEDFHHASTTQIGGKQCGFFGVFDGKLLILSRLANLERMLSIFEVFVWNLLFQSVFWIE